MTGVLVMIENGQLIRAWFSESARKLREMLRAEIARINLTTDYSEGTVGFESRMPLSVPIREIRGQSIHPILVWWSQGRSGGASVRR